MVRGAKGKPVTHHITFKLALPNGDVLRTRISRPIDGKAYGEKLFSHILRDQLCVNKNEFWSCVRGRILPARGEQRDVLPKHALPLRLSMELTRLGVDIQTMQTLDSASATELLAQLYQTGDDE